MPTTKNVPLSRRARKGLFRRALKASGLTAEAWIAQYGCSKGHFYEVIAGDRVSAPLIAAVDAFIASALPEQGKAA